MAAEGQELCPHCRRPFKRLRAHLPHCKAAPRSLQAPGSETSPGPARSAPPAPGTGPGTRPAPPGSALGTSPRPDTGTGSPAGPSAAPDPGPGRAAGPGTRRGPAGSRAVRDVARSLDLHPEEVQDVPRMLQKGVKVVIEKNRARVVREKERRGRAGSRGEGTEPGQDLHPQRPKTAQKHKSKETPSQGSKTASSKGEKSSLKATKALQEPPESRNSLVQQEGRDKSTAGEEQMHLEGVGGFKPPVAALHPQKLHLSLAEAFGGQGTSRNDLRRVQSPWAGGEGGPQPGLSPALPHPPQIRPLCSSRAPAGLEWFPDLYPHYEGLRIFPGKRFHEDVRVTAELPQGGLAQGQQGPLWERPLLEVRLGELHTWISTCSFSAQGLLGAVQRAWSSYCAKYIHVRQGGPAGISMLLAGYCLLSYGWNYQHFKRHRWRKYH